MYISIVFNILYPKLWSSVMFSIKFVQFEGAKLSLVYLFALEGLMGHRDIQSEYISNKKSLSSTWPLYSAFIEYFQLSYFRKKINASL